MARHEHTADQLLTIESLPCTRCGGSGTHTTKAFSYEGRHYPERTSPCVWCDGRGRFMRPDLNTILEAIKGRKGLRSKRPAARRDYYVWRMARFHGGADVTMPVCASMDVNGDPFVPLLDVIADAVAKHVFGTDLAAAHRWGRALGHLDQDLPGLPASAYACGPVADSDKPEEEQAELF